MSNRATRLLAEMAVKKAHGDAVRGKLPRTLHTIASAGQLLNLSDLPPEIGEPIREMLADDSHPYLMLIQELMRRTDPCYFTGFVVNFLLESVSEGGQAIRRHYDATGGRLPWLMGADVSTVRADDFAVPARLGMACFLLFGPDPDAQAVQSLCRRFPQAAFFLALPDGRMDAAFLKALGQAPNLFLLPVRRAGAFLSCGLLRQEKRLYAPLRVLGSEDLPPVLSRGILPAEGNELLPAFLLSGDVSPEARAEFLSLLAKLRRHPSAPVFPLCAELEVDGIARMASGISGGSFTSGGLPASLLLPDAALADRLCALAP